MSCDNMFEQIASRHVRTVGMVSVMAAIHFLEAEGLGDAVISIREKPGPAARRLVSGECPCGRRISTNKRFCRACAVKLEGEILAREMAARISDQATLDEVLATAGEHRAEVLERLRPYLSFTPAKEGSSVEETACESNLQPAAV